jgi:ATP-dependent Lon protease
VEVPEEVREKLDIVLVDTLEEALDQSLEAHTS